MNARSGEFLESLKDNPYMLNAALPYVNEAANNLAATHTSYTNERLQQEQIEASHQVFGDIVAGFSRGDYDEQDAIDALARETEELYQSGEKDARDILLTGIILEADATDNLDGLLMLATAHDQGKIKLSKEQKARLEVAVDQIESEISQKASKRSAEDQRAYDAMVKGHVNNYTQALLENPRLDAREFYKSTGVNDEELFRKLRTVQEAVQAAEKNSGATDGQIELAFQAELLAAGNDSNARLAVIQKYSGLVNGDDIRRELDHSIAMDNGDALYSSPHVKMLRDSYIQNVAILESDSFDSNMAAAAQTFAENKYNELMYVALKGVDPRDYNEIDQAHAQVVDQVNRMVLSKYPNMVDNVVQAADSNPPRTGNAEATGMDAVVQEAQAAAEAQMIAQDAALQNQARVEKTAADEDATMAQPVEQTGEIGKFVPGSLDEAQKEDTEWSEETVSFRSQLINKFTDGQFNFDKLNVGLRVLQEDPEFKAGVERLAAKYNVNPAAILAVMDFETGGTFDPAEPNKADSGATGLIQFMPNTARSLGTTTEALAQMNRAEQLVYVEKYLDQFSSKIRGGQIDDIYMAVLWPAAIGKPDNYVIFRQGTKTYQQNRGLDRNGDGTVTKEEAAHKVKAKFYGYK